jgi:hypothetical protein
VAVSNPVIVNLGELSDTLSDNDDSTQGCDYNLSTGSQRHDRNQRTGHQDSRPQRKITQPIRTSVPVVEQKGSP